MIQNRITMKNFLFFFILIIAGFNSNAQIKTVGASVGQPALGTKKLYSTPNTGPITLNKVIPRATFKAQASNNNGKNPYQSSGAISVPKVGPFKSSTTISTNQSLDGIFGGKRFGAATIQGSGTNTKLSTKSPFVNPK